MYFYHGYSLGLGSTIKKQVFTRAVCALSVRGGAAEASESKFASTGSYTISFDSAKSMVQGSDIPSNGIWVWTTEASVVIDNLDIKGKVEGEDQELFHVDHLEGHVVSEYRTGGSGATTCIMKDKDAKSGFTGLRIRGKPVQTVLAEDMFDRYVTWGSMQQDFGNKFTKDRFLSCVLGRGLPADKKPADRRAAYEAYREQEKIPALKSAVICSFVKEVNGEGIEAWGPVINVPNFGTIYLGEVIAWPWMLCLTMFRIELASGGTISGGSAGANGTNFPPGAYGGDGGYGGSGGP